MRLLDLTACHIPWAFRGRGGSRPGPCALVCGTPRNITDFYAFFGRSRIDSPTDSPHPPMCRIYVQKLGVPLCNS